MRLLKLEADGEFSLTSDITNPTTPYAILSHTWGEDDEEVTFEDLKAASGKTKKGYQKLQFCGEQAARDGLQYFWVDTCCINKKNYAEFSHAINSMFRWYRNATRCYVYLSDVPPKKRRRDGDSKDTSGSDFRESRWFTRGWTLQELLAPCTVEFFSRKRKRLGDRSSLRQQIHEITGVSKSALNGTPLYQFSVNERMSWINSRQTKLEEDKAYSLLGIFGVYVPARYGEGKTSAFKRLDEEIEKLVKCTRDLRLTDPRDDKKRIEETKGGLLEDAYRWVLDDLDFQQWRASQQKHLLWIKGDPGKGKTMLICGIINELKKSIAKSDLLSYFFCQATNSSINNATAVLRGLLYLLINQQPSLISYVRKKYDQAGKALFEDSNAWVALSEIFTNILQDPNLDNTLFIVDALDECIEGLPRLLDFIMRMSSVSPRVKWIISSRNWPSIEQDLDAATQKVILSLELNEDSVSVAVTAYIQFKVDQLAERSRYSSKTRDVVQRYLTQNAHGTFLWAALVCQELSRTSGWKAQEKLKVFPPGLNALYSRMMEQIEHSEDAELCKRILAVVSAVYQPLTTCELETLVDMPNGVSGASKTLSDIIGLCGSFLTLRECTASFVHQSAKDFLVENVYKEIFPYGIEHVHHTIFSRSLRVMSKTLRRDIFGLSAPGFPIDQVNQPSPDPLGSARYSCVYWVDHLLDCDASSNATDDFRDGGIVDKFLRESYLYWLEALSLCRSISEGVASMAKLEALSQARADGSRLLKLVHDARRFIMSHEPVLENNPLQAYASALLFSPAHSLIRTYFRHEEPKWISIQTPMAAEWGACLQTLEGHSGSVESVAFSHDSAWLASASSDGTIKIWDTSTGACLQTFRVHNNSIVSVVFSHDSAWLASGSYDRTVRIWDTNSGACLQTLKKHSSPILSATSVVFSHDSAQIASASYDNAILIWDTSSGSCLQILEGHSDWVRSIAFSHDSSRLVSASNDSIIKIWDTSNGVCLQTLQGHSSAVASVVFSHDSARLASASHDDTVKIWDTSSGACLLTLQEHSSWVWSVAFSHDSCRLASASHTTIKIWDTSSGACLQTHQGHSKLIYSVAFSPDSSRLASASADNTIRIWDASTGAYPQQQDNGHSGCVCSVVLSHDSAWLASASSDNTIKIWDTSTGTCLQTLQGHSRYVESVVFSHDSVWLASVSGDDTIKIWDTNSGACLQTLKTYNSSVPVVGSVVLSHDSTQIASASHDNTIKIWDTSSGACLQTLKGHSDWVESLAFSYDSSWCASASCDHTIKIWDASGVCLQTLKGHSASVKSVAFSYNSALLASASDDRTVKIWDTSGGVCLQTLDVGKALKKISFDTTGSFLRTEIGTISISVSSAPAIGTIIRYPKYEGEGLSPEGVWVTYNSENVLWLPSDYRPSCSSILGKTIGIGAGSGKVWMCELRIGNHLLHGQGL